jgi:hypothetical protein
MCGDPPRNQIVLRRNTLVTTYDSSREMGVIGSTGSVLATLSAAPDPRKDKHSALLRRRRIACRQLFDASSGSIWLPLQDAQRLPL